MNVTIGQHGCLTGEHAACVLARDCAQNPLPENAEWIGNVPVSAIAEVTNGALARGERVFILAPKGRDNITEDELGRWADQQGGGPANLVDCSDLPLVHELTEQGFVGAYRIPLRAFDPS